MLRRIIVLLIVFIILVISQDVFGQCSQCKLLAEQSATGDDEILGTKGSTLNTAILYIMAVPYIILIFLFRKQIVRLFKYFKAQLQ